MKIVSIAELKARASAVVRDAEGGEEYAISRRNKPVARLTAIPSVQNRTLPGFDPAVKIPGDVTGPALSLAEWGDLTPE